MGKQDSFSPPGRYFDIGGDTVRAVEDPDRCI